MEKAERRNETMKTIPISSVSENQFCVQMAALRNKVSSFHTNYNYNPVIVLSLSSISTNCNHNVAKNIPNCILNVNFEDVNVDHKRNGVLKSKAIKIGTKNVESGCGMAVVKHDIDDTRNVAGLSGKRSNKRRRKDVKGGESSDGIEKGVQHIKDGNLSSVDPVIVLGLASPSTSGTRGPQLGQNYKPLNPILNSNVDDDNFVVSPYFSKKNSSSRSLNCEGMNVCSHNSDKKDDGNMGKDELFNSKKRNTRIKDVGYGEVLSVKESGIGVNCYGMEQTKHQIGVSVGVESSDVENKAKYEIEIGEPHIKDGNLSRVKHETHKDVVDIMRGNVILKGKRSRGERKIRTSEVTMSDDDARVFSPYFSKVDDGHSGTMSDGNELLKKKKKRKMKKTPSMVDSPYFLADGANDYEKSKSDCMDKGEGRKVKKRSKIKDIRTSLEVDKEVKAEECQRKVTSKSNTVGLQESKVKEESGSDRENNSESHTEPHEATSPCSKNMRRKRVKLRKTDKSQDDQIPSSNKELSTIKISKKKHKRTLSFANCLLEGEQENVLESPSLEHKKEDCILNNQKFPQASRTLNLSTDFQKLPLNGKREDERDEPYCDIRSKRRIDKAALKAFDELLSNYAYKSDSMNGEGENDGANNEVSGEQERKKQRRGNSKTTLTREEKFAEAYRRKAPNNTWKPPSSPYTLLQEDHSHDPWRVLVICMLLNITTGLQVRKVLSLFFQLCPNAEAALNTNEIEIARVIESLGLHRKRAAMIKRLSREYLSHDWTHVTQLHGIGKYAADAYAIFCNGMWDQVTPNDHMLNYYWKYLKKHALVARDFWKMQ